MTTFLMYYMKYNFMKNSRREIFCPSREVTTLRPRIDNIKYKVE